MLRFLLVVVLVLVLLRFLARLAVVVLRALHEGSALMRAAPPPRSIALVRCDGCGVYVPPPVSRGRGDRALCRACAGG